MTIDLYHIINIDSGGGDAYSVVLIAWHFGMGKSCVLALLLYQESYKPSYFIFFFFFFLGGGAAMMNDEWMMM